MYGKGIENNSKTGSAVVSTLGKELIKCFEGLENNGNWTCVWSFMSLSWGTRWHRISLETQSICIRNAHISSCHGGSRSSMLCPCQLVSEWNKKLDMLTPSPVLLLLYLSQVPMLTSCSLPLPLNTLISVGQEMWLCATLKVISRLRESKFFVNTGQAQSSGGWILCPNKIQLTNYSEERWQFSEPWSSNTAAIAIVQACFFPPRNCNFHAKINWAIAVAATCVKKVC